MEKVYYKAIDYAKVICAILVVCVHTGPLLSINEEMNFFLVQVLARCAVPFFFLSSAFFFFKKIDRSKDLDEDCNIHALRKYLFHLGRMYLFWSLVYFSIQIVIWIAGGFTMHSFLLYVRDFFFRGSYYHLWFLPALMLGVFLVYTLLSVLKDEEVLFGSLILYGIGMLINVYGDVLKVIPVVGSLLKIYSTIFATARNGFFFAPIFVMMGYYLAQKKLRMNKWILYPGLILSFGLLVFEAYTIKSFGIMNDLTCMYVSLLPLVFILFQVLLTFRSNKKTTPVLRNGSTLLYLSHCYFTFLLQYVPIINENSLLYFIFTMIISIGFMIGYMRMSHKWTFLRKVI